MSELDNCAMPEACLIVMQIIDHPSSRITGNLLEKISSGVLQNRDAVNNCRGAGDCWLSVANLQKLRRM